ncbi:MAG: hypothetical protein K8R99_12180 [Actinomycetia bacterium]|nr:hypothetical protein [Actinomycetes bacterium]
MGRRQALDSINHRLALLDVVAHQVALIEELNARLLALEDRLWRNQVDQVSMEALSAKLQEMAIAMANRLEVTEQRLNDVSEQLAGRK